MQSGEQCLPRRSPGPLWCSRWGGGGRGRSLGQSMWPRGSAWSDKAPVLSWAAWTFKGLLSSSVGGRAGGTAGQGADLGRLLQGGTELGKSPRRPRPASYQSWCAVILLVVGQEARLLGVPSAAEGRGTSRPLPAGRLHTHPVVTANTSRCHHVPPWSKTASMGKPEAGGRSWPPTPRGPCVGGAGARRGAEMYDLQLQGQTPLLSLGLSKSQHRVHVRECS